VARQRSDVRPATGTALFAGNQDRPEILGHRIAGHPVRHHSQNRRYTRQTPRVWPATRETGDNAAPQKMMAAPEQAGKALMPNRGHSSLHTYALACMTPMIACCRLTLPQAHRICLQ
jgi:hypothetical protein